MYFPANVEKHLTHVLQSSWMNNFALRYSEAAVHRFFFKISFFKNFAIFTEKHMGWNLFLKKLLV